MILVASLLRLNRFFPSIYQYIQWLIICLYDGALIIKYCQILALVGVFLLAVPKLIAAATLPSVGKGTLIVFVTTRDGMLVCADKRLTHGPDDYRDDSMKLAQIGPNIVFAVSGVPYIEARDGYGNGYDAVTVVRDYFAQSEFDDSVLFWTGVKQGLFDNFSAYLKARPYDFWPPTLFPEANNSFTQLLFFFSDKNDRVQVKLIQLRYMKQSKPLVEVRSFDVQPYGLYDSLGWSKLDHELKKGHDHRFNDLREDASHEQATGGGRKHGPSFSLFKTTYRGKQ